ncbi:uncharacterized protein [Cherax quadricarinatus]
MSRVIFLLLLWSLSVHLPGRCDDPSPPLDDEDDDDIVVNEGKCEPALADNCFDDVNENLLCHVVSPVGRICKYRTAQDFCTGLDDALNCTSDIVDSDCSPLQGREVFDVWLSGLRAVQRALCQDDSDLTLLYNLLKSSNCWNFKKFIKCVEETVNVTHISDLLTTKLDKYECNLLQLSVGICNADSEKNHLKCRRKADAVQEAVAVFFANTACGETVCARHSSRSITQVGGSSGSAVVLTLVVVLVVLALVVTILVKHKVLILQASRPHFCASSSSSPSNDDQEEYDRFH